MSNGMKNDWEALVGCECGDRRHMMVLAYDKEFGLEVNFQLQADSTFLHRIWRALKYVFSPRLGTTMWEEIVVSEEMSQKFQTWLDQAKKDGYGSFWV